MIMGKYTLKTDAKRLEFEDQFIPRVIRRIILSRLLQIIFYQRGNVQSILPSLKLLGLDCPLIHC